MDADLKEIESLYGMHHETLKGLSDMVGFLAFAYVLRAWSLLCISYCLSQLGKKVMIWQENFIFRTATFGHSNVIGFDGRPFENVDEMDHYMIEYWNMRVGKDDEVYIVGDFQFRGDKGPVWYLKRLKGIKFLVVGNHDLVTLKYPGALDYFEKVEKIMHVKDGDHNLVICHFPILEWDGYYRDTLHIYGHIHNRLNETALIMRSRKRAFNAAAAINGYMPVTLDELIENNRRFEQEHPLSWTDLPPRE